MKKLIVFLLATVFFTGCGYITFYTNDSGDLKMNKISKKELQKDEELMRNSSHLKFRNVPIDGTLDKFVERMGRNGFKLESKRGGEAKLSGDFADFKKCTVRVETLSGNDLVSRISVEFPDRDKWEKLNGDYVHLKELLTTKYGEPTSSIEEFKSSYKIVTDDDWYKMSDVRADRCNYETRYVTDNGIISLSIANGDHYHTYVKLSYEDKINSKIVRDQAIKDL